MSPTLRRSRSTNCDAKNLQPCPSPPLLSILPPLWLVTGHA